MKYLSLFLAVTMHCAILTAQTKLKGTVKDHRGRPLAGVSITIKDSYDGSISDSTGVFQFSTTEKGTKSVQASSMGYQPVEQVLQIGLETMELNFVLKEIISELKAVIVTAGSFEAGDKKKAATVLSTLDVLTTGGANADITAVIKTLPGAQQIGEQEGLFVRGGSGIETKQFIDGTMVNNPFYAAVPDLAQRGRFSPNLFKGTIFSTGGYSALYGQALSSALILESIDIPERSEASVAVSPIFLGAGLQKIAKDKQSSWGVRYDYTHLGLYFSWVPQKPDYFTTPAYHTAETNFRIRTKTGGIVKYYTSYATSELGLRRPNIDDANYKNAFSLQNKNWYQNLSYRENLGKGWKMNLAAGHSWDKSQLQNQIQNASNLPAIAGLPWIDSTQFQLITSSTLSQFKLVFDKRLSGISVLRFGGEYQYSVQSTDYALLKSKLKDRFSALFSEADIYITNDLAAKLGLRIEHSSLLNKMNIAPRASIAYKVGKGGQMSFAFGTFYQKPENLYLYANPELDYTKATHYILNYIKNTSLQTFRVEAYYKKYEQLVKTYPAINNQGNGYAKGIEFFWRDKKTIKGLDYWVSYSFLDTERDHLNFPEKMTPNFAAKNTGSLVIKRFYPKINTGFNFTYSYASGRPYYRIANGLGGMQLTNRGNTIDYHSLGFSTNLLASFHKTYAIFVASVTNLLNSQQVFGYNYSHDGMQKEAIKPAAPQFFFLGVFLSWGVDRRQDIINSNL